MLNSTEAQLWRMLNDHLLQMLLHDPQHVHYFNGTVNGTRTAAVCFNFACAASEYGHCLVESTMYAPVLQSTGGGGSGSAALVR